MAPLSAPGLAPPDDPDPAPLTSVPAARSASGALPRSLWIPATLYLVTVAVVALCGWILSPFLPAITGAVVLAVATHRPHCWLREKLRSRTAAALSALLLVIVSIITPAVFVVQNLARHALVAARMLQNGWPQLSAALDRFPLIAGLVEQSSEFISLSEAAQKFAAFLASHLVGFFSNSLAALTQIGIMLFLLFFLYRDEETSLRFLYRLLPLSDGDARLLVLRLTDTIRATVLGRLFVAVAQGALAGIIFASLGVHVALLLGVLTAIAGLVPPFGAYLVWLPVAAYFAITGHWIRMGILLVAGSLLISTLDNFLYPALVGSHLRQHTATVFLSLLGGVWLFGIAGLVLGPVLFSTAEALLAIWKSQVRQTA